jgi:hypothetical protein
MNLTVRELQALGSSLREIDPSALQSDPDEGDLRWFQGEQGTELFIWARLQGVDHVQLVLQDQTVDWNERTGVSTGHLSLGAAPLGGRYDRYVVQPARGQDLTLCRAALTLLQASPLAAEAAERFVRALAVLLDEPLAPPAIP